MFEAICKFFLGDNYRPFANARFGHTDMTITELRAMRDDEIKDLNVMLADGSIDQDEYEELMDTIADCPQYQNL